MHAVEAALQNPHRTVTRLLMTENAENRLGAALAGRNAPERVSPRDLDRLLGADTVHQGVLLETEPLPEPSLNEIAAAADTGGPLVVLDQVTDPHNVGAILRSCAVFGACGLVMTRRHSPPLEATLAKSASGALELVPIALVQNLARSIDAMKELGFTTIGLDDEAEHLLGGGAVRGPRCAGARGRRQGPARADAHELRQALPHHDRGADRQPQRFERGGGRAASGGLAPAPGPADTLRRQRAARARLLRPRQIATLQAAASRRSAGAGTHSRRRGRHNRRSGSQSSAGFPSCTCAGPR